MSEEELKVELQRAYRCIQGFWTAYKNGTLPTSTVISYHSLTIAAACRFIKEDTLDGTEYFIGKTPEVLQDALYSNT